MTPGPVGEIPPKRRWHAGKWDSEQAHEGDRRCHELFGVRHDGGCAVGRDHHDCLGRQRVRAAAADCRRCARQSHGRVRFFASDRGGERLQQRHLAAGGADRGVRSTDRQCGRVGGVAVGESAGRVGRRGPHRDRHPTPGRHVDRYGGWWARHLADRCWHDHQPSVGGHRFTRSRCGRVGSPRAVDRRGDGGRGRGRLAGESRDGSDLGAWARLAPSGG